MINKQITTSGVVMDNINILETIQGPTDRSTLYTPIPYSNEVRDKIRSIVMYSINCVKRVISAQYSNTQVRFLSLSNSNLKLDRRTSENDDVPETITAKFLSVVNKLSDILQNNLSGSTTPGEKTSITNIIENDIPHVLNVYLTTSTYSPIQLKNVLLRQNMFPPYSNTNSSNELQINPRYNFIETKSYFVNQHCNSNKECYVKTLYNDIEFAKFNKINRTGKRLGNIQQVTPNVTGNIETTLSILLPNSTLKINDEEFVITDYEWDHEWKLLGPKGSLLSLEPQYLKNNPEDVFVTRQSCYKKVVELYDDLVELFYPSMSGKDITKMYGNYLKMLNERNGLLNQLKKLVNMRTLSIKTADLNQEDKDKLISLSNRSQTLNESVDKFVESVCYQLVIIGNITRNLINKVHTPCFFYFGFDKDLYNFGDEDNQDGNDLETSFSGNIAHIKSILKSDNTKTKTLLYIGYLENLYYESSGGYKKFFENLKCDSLFTDQYTEIVRNFSIVIKTSITKLDRIVTRMVDIQLNPSQESIDLPNESLSKLWISDIDIEAAFGKFEKNVRRFIKYNLIDTYYSNSTIESWIDEIFWDMVKSNGFRYCRLFTIAIFDDLIQQFEILFSFKILQYIFLIFQYTGKYIYYQNIESRSFRDDESYVKSLVDGGVIIEYTNLFTLVVNWFKYNCIREIMKIRNSTPYYTREDLQRLFATNELILGSYTLMKYYITQIILVNVDVCHISQELETYVDILSPNKDDLKNIIPGLISENAENNGDKPVVETKENDVTNDTNPKTLSYNVNVNIRVKKISNGEEVKEELNSDTVYEYLGCKNRDLQFQLNKLRQSAETLTGDITQYVSKQSTLLLTAPNKHQLYENFYSDGKSQSDDVGYNKNVSQVKSMFDNPDYIQITKSANFNTLDAINENGDKDDIFLNINNFVYKINKVSNDNGNDTKPNPDEFTNLINMIFGKFKPQ